MVALPSVSLVHSPGILPLSLSATAHISLPSKLVLKCTSAYLCFLNQ